MARKRHVEPPAESPQSADGSSSEPATFTIAELAARWKSSRYTIHLAIKSGKLRTFKVGERNVRVALEEVLRYERGEAVAS